MIRITDFPRRFAASNKLRQKTFLSQIAMEAVGQPRALRAPMISALRTMAPIRGQPRHHGLVKDVMWKVPTRGMSVVAVEEPEATYVDDWKTNMNGRQDKWLLGPRPSQWWTGPFPVHGVCPGVLPDGTMTSLPQPDATKASRQDLLDYFDNTWALTEVLFSALHGEEPFYRPPYHNLRHPLMFYYGHPAVVYVNKMRIAGLLDGPIDSYFEHIFAIGVDEMSWDDMNKNHMAWPTVQEVTEYRRKVYAAIRKVILEHPAFETFHKELDKNPFWSVVMGFEHERIHLETSSVLYRELPKQFLRKPEQWPAYHPAMANSQGKPSKPEAGSDFPVPEFVPVEGGKVVLGKPRDVPTFGWDNEYGRKEMDVQSFRAGKYLVTNGQFYEFVLDGGYYQRELWSEDGWGWRCFRNIRHPTFWVPEGPAGFHAFKLRTIFEEVDMPWSNPVDVNFHEAKAFAKWMSAKEGRKGDHEYRLTTEAEHHMLRDLGADKRDDPVVKKSGHGLSKSCNLNLAYGMTSPVDAFPPNKKGFHDVFGSAWHWCEDNFNALPGFKVHHVYDDFSMPCFDGKHNIIMGGSFISTGDEASRYARFHFRPHFFQHAGFRLVEPNDKDPALVTSCMDNAGPYASSTSPFRSSPEKVLDGKDQYEDRTWLQRYLHLHYPDASDKDAFPGFLPREAIDFPKRCADLLIETATRLSIPTTRALDLGCAVGGSTFALARAYPEVHGIELSESFVDTAKQIQSKGSLPYQIKAEGDLYTDLVARVPADVDRSRVKFAVGDALALGGELGTFDGILVANVVCRLPDPATCLTRMATGETALIRPGGLIMFTTPFSWKDEFTPKDLWLGGRKNADGSKQWSLDGFMAVMERLGFELVEQRDLPLVIRQHSRLYEFIGAHATIWRKK